MKKILIFFFLINFSSNAADLKIVTLVTVNNAVITNIDLDNEIRIIKILNPNLDLQKININQNALNNLINDNLKKIEIQKNKININEKIILNQYTKVLENLNSNNLKISKNLEDLIYTKIKLEVQWNQFIANKYSSQLNINMQEIKKKIVENKEAKDLESIINIEKNKKLTVYSNNHLDNLKKNSLIKFIK